MTDSEDIVSLEIASAEFSTAYGTIIGKLILEKLLLVQENAGLKTNLAKLEYELRLKKSQPEPEELVRNT